MSRASAPNLPPLPGVDWHLLAESQMVLVGAGAVGRPLARGLAQLGLGRAVIVDPKRYTAQSVASQCRLDEVGRLKAEATADELGGLGVAALAVPRDVEDLPPGHLEDSLVIVSVDNRRAEIIANRLAINLRCPLVKVNIEPLFLTASLRCYDFSHSPPEICLECQFSDAHYADQRHPRSCDGDTPGRPTASPRPLCEFAATAAALITAQIVASAEQREAWRGRQWQANLFGGGAQISHLSAQANCRCDHTAAWRNRARLNAPLAELTLADLLHSAGASAATARLQLSSQATTSLRCPACGQIERRLRWLKGGDDQHGVCACGEVLSAVPFYCFNEIAAAELAPWIDLPLATWGVEPESIIAVAAGERRVSFILSGP